MAQAYPQELAAPPSPVIIQPTPNLNKGMGTDEVLLISAASIIAAGLIGTGIYQFTKKDKSDRPIANIGTQNVSSGNKPAARSEEISPALQNFLNAEDIRDKDRLFKLRSQEEKMSLRMQCYKTFVVQIL